MVCLYAGSFALATVVRFLYVPFGYVVTNQYSSPSLILQPTD